MRIYIRVTQGIITGKTNKIENQEIVWPVQTSILLAKMLQASHRVVYNNK